MKRLIIRILTLTAAVVACIYLLGVVVWGSHRHNDRTVQQVTVCIEDIQDRQFVSEQDLVSLLRCRNIYPIGHVMDSVRPHDIEKALLQHPMIRTAECYKLSSPCVYIRVTQRVPLLYVKTAAETYLIDTDRKRMNVPDNLSPIPMRITGHVGERMAREDLADFVCWLYRQPFWRERIASVHVHSPKSITLYQKGDEPRILLGELNGYTEKLHRLRVWYNNASDYPDMPHYTELDVRFRSQVIGRK